MSKFRLKKGLQMERNNIIYTLEKRLPNGYLVLKNQVTDENIQIKEFELQREFVENKMNVISNSVRKEIKNKNALEKLNQADFSLLPEKIKNEAKRRYSYVLAVLEENPDSLTNSILEPIIKKVALSLADERPPSPITLYRWVTFYIECESIRALVPLHNGKGNLRKQLPDEVHQVIDDVINEKYLSLQKPTVMSVYWIIINRIKEINDFRNTDGKLPYPSRTTIYNIINEFDPYKVMVARFGQRLADYEFNTTGQIAKQSRVLERVEMDHTHLDIMVIDEKSRLPLGRPNITVAIDVYSKCILGYYLSFEPPSGLSLMQCLKHAITPKCYIKDRYPEVQNDWKCSGIPETVMVDNGKDFIGVDFEDACLQLGINIQYAPPKKSWFKPTVERFFGTLNKELIHELPGTTFSNTKERGEYKSTSNACITLDSLQTMIHLWIIDFYHQKYHRGIHAVPSKVWDLSVEDYPTAYPLNIKDLDILLGHTEKRVLTRHGIELFGLFYNSSKLSQLRRAIGDKVKVKIKYDPSDISVIHIYNPETLELIQIPALNFEYALNLSKWQHEKIKQLAMKEFNSTDKTALALSKQKIMNIVEKELKNTKKTTTASKAARWNRKGIESTNETSSKLDIKVISSNENTQSNKSNQIENIDSIPFAPNTNSVKNEKPIQFKIPKNQIIAEDDLDMDGFNVKFNLTTGGTY